MARINKCKVCLSTDPASGWAGTNHNLCNECVSVRDFEQQMARDEARHQEALARAKYLEEHPEQASRKLNTATIAAAVALMAGGI